MRETIVEGGLIRKLWVGEADDYRAHLLRLDPESRRSRFGGAVSDDVIRSYVETACTVETVIHGCFVDGVLRGAAELRPFAPGEAEAAFSVEKPWQSHGVGSALLERTLLVARNRGIKLLHMCCLAENRRMQDLAKKFDADLKFDFGTVIGEVENPHPTPISMLREFFADGQSFTHALLDAQARLLKAS
jgi:GNAT superfamily N-acetyltransferase